jgi:sugar/nucleoside kinase (ribokinase family)
LAQFDVTLAGEITMDLLLYGLPEELPVERELVADHMALTLGGSSAITAHNLAVLGSRTGFIPQLGADAFTEVCVDTLRAAGVDLSHAVAPKTNVGTGLTVLLQHQRSRRALTYSGTASGLRYEDLDLAYLASGKHFHLSSFFLQSGLWDDVPKLLATMRSAGLTTSLDTNDDPADLWDGPIAETLAHLDILMPNEREACKLANESSFEDAVKKLAETTPLLVVNAVREVPWLCTKVRVMRHLDTARVLWTSLAQEIASTPGFFMPSFTEPASTTASPWVTCAVLTPRHRAAEFRHFRIRHACNDFLKVVVWPRRSSCNATAAT